MGLPRVLVNRAVLIDALPREVKALFFLRGSLTFGGDARSSRNVIDELCGKHDLPYDDINVRVTRDRGIKFLKIECDDAARMSGNAHTSSNLLPSSQSRSLLIPRRFAY